MSRVVSYIGLGANLGEPQATLRAAVDSLAALPQCRLLAVSSFYRSKPLDDMPQPDYVNGVAALETDLSAEALLDALQAIENQFGRQRGERWAARSLDLDILLYGEQQIRSARLTVPHPGLCLREFVLIPLAEIAPQLQVPGCGSIAQRAAEIDARGMQKLES